MSWEKTRNNVITIFHAKYDVLSSNSFILNDIPYIVPKVYFWYLSLEKGSSGYNSFNSK